MTNSGKSLPARWSAAVASDRDMPLFPKILGPLGNGLSLFENCLFELMLPIRLQATLTFSLLTGGHSLRQGGNDRIALPSVRALCNAALPRIYAHQAVLGISPAEMGPLQMVLQTGTGNGAEAFPANWEHPRRTSYIVTTGISPALHLLPTELGLLDQLQLGSAKPETETTLTRRFAAQKRIATVPPGVLFVVGPTDLYRAPAPVVPLRPGKVSGAGMSLFLRFSLER
jgi:hypothetical protein